MKKEEKTNVCRVLDAKKISYVLHTYEQDPSMSGEEIAKILGEDPDKVFKTLVTQGKSGAYYVFVVPVKGELDLKKAAKASGEKAKRSPASYRVCAWRMLADRNEKAVSNISA